MKPQSILLFLVLACLCTAAIPRRAAADESGIVGTWTAEQQGVRVRVTFGPDGSFARTMTGASGTATVRGQYLHQGNMLMVQPQGQTFIQYTIRELEHDRLVLVGTDGVMLDLARAPAGAPPSAPAKPVPAAALPARGSQAPEKGISVFVAIRPLKQVNPIYPPAAKTAGVQGVVRLRVTINKDGSVQDIRVLSGNVQLVKASLGAVPDWRWAPSKGVRVTVVTIAFTLPTGSSGRK